MNSKKTSKQMIALMSRQSLKSSRMRNVFVMVTIVLASALDVYKRQLFLHLLDCNI